MIRPMCTRGTTMERGNATKRERERGHKIWGKNVERCRRINQNLQFEPKKNAKIQQNLEHLNGSFPFFPQQPLDHIEENPGPVRLWGTMGFTMAYNWNFWLRKYDAFFSRAHMVPQNRFFQEIRFECSTSTSSTAVNLPYDCIYPHQISHDIPKKKKLV